MNELYPLKFKPILKDNIWGGEKLKTVLKKKFGTMTKAGESWEISCVQDNISVICEGFLAGNNLQEAIEIYMGDLVGDKIYKKFGIEFPLLIKFIDANQDLSIQVHPDDELSKKRHNAYGKTEMWYVIDAEKDAKLISGFNKETNKNEYLRHLNSGTLPEILNTETVHPGDVFFIPAGRVHAIGAGILLAEIQQTSDVTYRIYDYNRSGNDGKPRELHTELAIEAIDYHHETNYRTEYQTSVNETAKLAQCTYFTTNKIIFNKQIHKDYNLIESFVIYMCLDGKFTIDYRHGKTVVEKGETIMLPAVLKDIYLEPHEKAEILEVYVL